MTGTPVRRYHLSFDDTQVWVKYLEARPQLDYREYGASVR